MIVIKYDIVYQVYLNINGAPVPLMVEGEKTTEYMRSPDYFEANRMADEVEKKLKQPNAPAVFVAAVAI